MGRGKSWEEVKPGGNSANYYDVYDRFALTDEYTRVRLLGDVFELKVHWIPTKTKKGGDSAFPVLCRKNEADSEKCCICRAGLRTQTIYLTNAIIRDIQEDEPKKKGKIPEGTEYRKPGDKWWSPVRVLQIPAGAVTKIQRFSENNKVKLKSGEFKVAPINDPKYGRDLEILFDSTQTGSGMYDIQKGERSPLTDEEKEYLLYNLEEVYNYIQPDSELLTSLASAYERGVFNSDNCDEKSLRRVLKSVLADDDEDDDSEDAELEDLDDEEEEERPSKKSKSAKKSSKKSKRRDEDEDEDLEDDDDLEDDEDEEEEERPSKKSKSKKTSSKSKKRRDDDDDDDEELEEDDDLDEDDEDDEEEEKPSKKSKNSKKSKSRDEDDDDDDLEEDDDLEDEEDDDLEDDDEKEEERPSKKSKSAKKSSKKSKRRDEDEDEDLEDDDDLEDDEDEEEEERPRKKGGKKKK